MIETLPLIVWYLDDPVADPALVPLYFIAREARKHVKVVLSGEGADELFGGYKIYREPLSLRAVRAACRARCARLLGAVSRRLPEGMRGKDLLRRGVAAAGGALLRQRPDLPRGRDAAAAAHATTRRGRTRDVTDRASTRETVERDPIARMQHVDLFTWLRGDILVKADKMTMANSLELRVPFLDTEVFEVASTHPGRPEGHQGDDEVRAAPGAGAASSRRTCCTGASSASRCRSGTGCADEMYDWAREHRRDSQADAPDRPRPPCCACWTRTAPGRRDYSRKIWTLLVFLIWHGIFVEGRIRPEIPEPVYPVTL